MKKFLKLFLLLSLLAFIGLGANGGCGGCGEDTVKPQVMITEPTNNSIVSGIVPIKANATDNVGVSKVEFYVDNNKIEEITASPYVCNWDTSGLQYNSTHIIQAKAYDAAGNVGESPLITVTIGDSQLPTVTITNPVDGGTVIGIVTIKANAVDRSISKGKSKAPSGIQKVEFYVDDIKLGEDSTAPYEYSWNTDSLAYGSSHTIYAKAYDNTGKAEVSPSITVTIGDDLAPNVTITSPANGETVTELVTIKADAIDRSISKGKMKAPSGVQKVEFYIDEQLKYTDYNSPYSYNWNTDSLQYGSTHIVTVIAYDFSGNTGRDSVAVTIGNGEAPMVTITSPANGETVTELVIIKADAIDRSISKGKTKAPSGIKKVEFYVNDIKLGEDLTAPYEYSWNTDSLAYGSTHTIQAKAYDNAGNVGESPIITVKIGDTQTPEVTITSPASSVVPGSAIITIKASVQDRSKTSKVPTGIQKVEFYVNDNKIGETTASPYACNWDTSGLKHNTTHTITVKAYDNAGNIGTASLSVTINVEWTVLMYLDGHNNLYSAIQNELNYLNDVTSTAGINVVILAGLSQTNPLSYLRYFHNGTFQTLSQGNYNFGDPAILQNFLTTGIQNFPAKRYMVILKDHGSGWRRPIEGTFTRDICWDDIYDSSLTIPELKSALQPVVSLLGKKIDLVYFDACLMGNVEVDYEIKDLASYLVSSEAVGWGGGTRWDNILNQLVANPTMSPDSLGVLTAQTYFSSYPTMERTIAVKDLSKIDDIMEKIYYFAYYLRDCLPDSASAAMYWRNQTQGFAPYGDYPEVYIDLYQYADFVLNNTDYNNLQTAATNLMSSITSSVLYYTFYGYSSAKGYSIWFPDSGTYYEDGYSKYSALDFSQSTYGNEWFWFLYDEFTALTTGSTQKGKVRIDKE